MNLSEAKTKAKTAGYFVVTKSDCFLLYRAAKPKNVLVGKRKEEKGIIKLVESACSTS